MADTRDTAAPPPTRGPVRGGERTLAPDLARGAMLLLIALAHSPTMFVTVAPAVDLTPHGLERAYNVFMFTFVHARALPLFAIMFGYGLVQLTLRQDAATGSPDAARRVLLRRSAWLLVFGAVHGCLLFSGDILGAYGIMGIVFTLVLLRRGDRVHRIAVWYMGFAAVYIAVLAALSAWGLATGSGTAAVATTPFPSAEAPDYLSSVLARLGEWPMSTLVLSAMILTAWLGAWAARHRILEEPAKHRTLLRRSAAVGLGVSVAGGLPMGLMSAGWLSADAATAALLKRMYEVSGVFGGIGYVALFGLIALAVSRGGRAPRSNPVVTALSALGQRSMSGYLFQSVAWLVLGAPFALDLVRGAGSPTFAAAGLAVTVWLTTLACAYLMHRRSYRGPAEILLRRLSYGPRPRAAGSPTAAPSTGADRG
ncbi:putative membrane protein YeiB [Murinocardiopsis flavida]|uniref:Putative membrane protein YeiB n=1 Tax=Murinocardiopsis flavida TaxID=645275 RepID=A0A2P8DLB7_9ACTN|nr:DUF418 domain-containing protein [Murinocardiopsis flavida]PSK98013.1 putative membrane protein YeiB [Murinocardiopsis flavida]